MKHLLLSLIHIFTGGEPLVRKGIFDLLEQMRRIEGAEKLTITTNGALLEEALPWLEAV